MFSSPARYSAAFFPIPAMLCVGCNDLITPSLLRNIFVRSPTHDGVSFGLYTGESTFIFFHVCVGRSKSPCPKYSIHVSSTVSAPPSTSPIDFIDECIRIVSFPVKPISFNCSVNCSLVYILFLALHYLHTLWLIIAFKTSCILYFPLEIYS